jgi:hypothetical protein
VGIPSPSCALYLHTEISAGELNMTRHLHLETYQEIYCAPPTALQKRPNLGARYYLSDKPSQVCWACLGDHESTMCSQKRCYRCAKPGHEGDMCGSREYCGKCNSPGHSELSQCPMHQYNLGLNPEGHSLVQCLACGAMGHINCKSTRGSHFVTGAVGKRGREN